MVKVRGDMYRAMDWDEPIHPISRMHLQPLLDVRVKGMIGRRLVGFREDKVGYASCPPLLGLRREDIEHVRLMAYEYK